MTWVKLGALAAFADEAITSRDVGGEPVIIVRRGAAVACFLDRCSHINIQLSKFGCIYDGQILCNAHGAMFDSQTGAVRQAPAQTPLHSLPVQVRDADVWVDSSVISHKGS